jgi:SAM-dependent methyltransferase
MNQRLLNEREYHDTEAASRARTFERDPSRLRLSDSDYLDHASWIRPAMAKLGDVAGKRILDFGCGHGMAAVVLARCGAFVSAFDLSPGYVAEARQRAVANEAIIDFTVGDGHALPYADGSFDAIWGHAILHHLDIAVAAREIRRVLRPGGIAVFCEPWDGNPLVRWLRRWRRHTVDERAISTTEIKLLEHHLMKVVMERFQMGRYVVIAIVTECSGTTPVPVEST